VQSSASKSSRGSGDFEAFSSSINNLGSSNLTIAQMKAREKAMIEERKMQHESEQEQKKQIEQLKRDLGKEISQLRKEKRKLRERRGERLDEKRSRGDDAPDGDDPVLQAIAESMADIDDEIKENQKE
jgi:chromosome segregation ATPase